MLIDPTDTEASISLLHSLKLTDQKLKVCCVGDFVEDTDEFARSEVVLKIKTAMAVGETVVLINSGPIRSSFYDVFNRHFAMLAVESNEVEDAKTQYYANVAVGSFSRPCVVDPNFKIIVHMPISSLSGTQLPFLNRFEKYILSVEDALQEKIQKRNPSEREEY